MKQKILLKKNHEYHCIAKKNIYYYNYWKALEREKEEKRDTMKPKAKVPMTELMRETAESSISPRWPTKMFVKELTPYWHKMLKTIGNAIFHILTVSIMKTFLVSLNPFTSA